MKVKVLFVCLGNICRSPMGEGAFIHHVEKAGLSDRFEIDSAGTAAYHVGSAADERMRNVAHSHGIILRSRARQITVEDLGYYDYILAMDSSNFSNIQKLVGRQLNNLHLMRDFDEQLDHVDVPDPYYGGLEGFENVYQMMIRSTEKLMHKLVAKYQIER